MGYSFYGLKAVFYIIYLISYEYFIEKQQQQQKRATDHKLYISLISLFLTIFFSWFLCLFLTHLPKARWCFLSSTVDSGKSCFVQVFIHLWWKYLICLCLFLRYEWKTMKDTWFANVRGHLELVFLFPLYFLRHTDYFQTVPLQHGRCKCKLKTTLNYILTWNKKWKKNWGISIYSQFFYRNIQCYRCYQVIFL